MGTAERAVWQEMVVDICLHPILSLDNGMRPSAELGFILDLPLLRWRFCKWPNSCCDWDNGRHLRRPSSSR